MAHYLGIILLILASCNTQSMENKNCESLENYNKVKSHILTKGVDIKLSERLIADKTIVAKEISIDKKFIAYTDNKIFIIEKDRAIPPYYCYLENNQVRLASYEARFDTPADIQQRKTDWCQTVENLD